MKSADMLPLVPVSPLVAVHVSSPLALPAPSPLAGEGRGGGCAANVGNRGLPPSLSLPRKGGGNGGAIPVITRKR
jgi:hypothetical protein